MNLTDFWQNDNAPFQGQSAATAPKQAALASFLDIHVGIVEQIYRKGKCAQYVYIETNSGCGYNSRARCDGSPVVALRYFTEKAQMPWQCVFVEKDASSCVRLADVVSSIDGISRPVTLLSDSAGRQYSFLASQIASCPEVRFIGVDAADLGATVKGLLSAGRESCLIINFDNAYALPQVWLPSRCYGLVYADPNALKDSPEEAMRTFFLDRNASRLDFLFNLDGHMRRRVIASQNKGYCSGYNDLRSLMRRVGKKHWWVRDPVPGTGAGSSWVFLFGANYPDLKIKSLKESGLSMHKVESPKGKEVLARLMGDNFPGQLALPL